MGGNLYLSVIGLAVAILVLMVLAYRGWNIIIYSLIATVIVCLFSRIDLWNALKNVWAAESGNYVAAWLILFVEGAVFGNIYKDTGAAASVADFLGHYLGRKNPFIPVFAASYLLTMSGISSFVLIFCVYPIAIRLFERANISKRLLPAVFCYAVWTVATASPGSAQVPNLIPMETLGTSAMAGAVPGFVFALAVTVINTWYITRESRKLRAAGIEFEHGSDDGENGQEQLPNVVLSLLPLVVIIVLFNVCHFSAEAALLVGICLLMLLFFRKLTTKEWARAWCSGAETSASVLIHTATVVGFGAVVLQTPVCDAALQWISASRLNPYILAFAVANVFSLILGSATSSISLAMQTMGNTFLEYGVQGYNLGFMHRILTQAAMGLGTLPHSGALLAVFQICGLTYRDGYKYVCFCTIICPIVVSLLIQLPLCMLLAH